MFVGMVVVVVALESSKYCVAHIVCIASIKRLKDSFFFFFFFFNMYLDDVSLPMDPNMADQLPAVPPNP